MFIHVSVFMFVMEPKITLDQFKKLRKLEGEIGAHLDTLTEKMENTKEGLGAMEKSLKKVQTDYKKVSDILEEIRETTGIESFD